MRLFLLLTHFWWIAAGYAFCKWLYLDIIDDDDDQFPFHFWWTPYNTYYGCKPLNLSVSEYQWHGFPFWNSPAEGWRDDEMEPYEMWHLPSHELSWASDTKFLTDMSRHTNDAQAVTDDCFILASRYPDPRENLRLTKPTKSLNLPPIYL